MTTKTREQKTIQFQRYGDFYEAFDDDARTLAKICGFTLVRPSRQFKGTPKVMCGVPMHMLDAIKTELKQAGVIVDILE